MADQVADETADEQVDDEFRMGAVDYLVVEFPGSRFNGEVLPAIYDLIAKGLVRVLDLLVITKTDEGEVVTVDLVDAQEQLGELLAALVADRLGVLDADDVASVGAVIDPGTTAAVIVWENLWAVPFAQAVEGSGGLVVSRGNIPLTDLLDALPGA